MLSWRPSRTVLMLLLLAFAPLVFSGGEAAVVPLTCPLCGKPFDGMQAAPSLRVVGSDSDFCTYYEGGSVRAFEVQVCTNCGYSDTLSFFLSGKTLPGGVRRKISARLSDLWRGGKWKNQAEIPIARKFEAALVCARARGTTPEKLAALAHLAAWAVRDKITFRALDPRYRMPLEAFEVFEKEYKALELNSPADFSAAFRLLQAAVRLGLPATRKRLSALISAEAPRFFSAEDTEKLSRQLRAFEQDAGDEAAFLSEAADLFEEALSVPGLEERNRMLYTYLVGELRRRCGDAESARKWLASANVEGQRPDVRKLIPVLLKHCEEAGGAESSFSRFPQSVCPLCGRKTPRLPRAEPDYMGGADCDFCTYSLDQTAYAAELITCLHCGYTRFADRFEGQLNEEEKKKVRAALTAVETAALPSSPRGLTCWKKYELAALCQEALGKSPLKIGMSWVNAAWSARRTCCAPTMEMDLPDGPLMPETARKLASKLVRGDFEDACLAAFLCDRAGLRKQRRKCMKRAAKLAGDIEERTALLKSAARLFALEERYLERAVPYLEKAEEGGKDYEFYRFLLGEALRRTGKGRRAKRILEECVSFPRVGKNAKAILRSM